ncbi:hypothetical protein [Rhodococcus sp. EPR-157]|uniref:hypothetical protein n=1 Tax=Rhodococcus sp. EPR-157 TaxID=1813677 RepID=UPI0012E77B52|nr:hypothetical protein [Rhodococcus sp. EPR-157]
MPATHSIDWAIDGSRAHRNGALTVTPSAREPCWSGRGRAPAAGDITAPMPAERAVT